MTRTIEMDSWSEKFFNADELTAEDIQLLFDARQAGEILSCRTTIGQVRKYIPDFQPEEPAFWSAEIWATHAGEYGNKSGQPELYAES